MTIAAQYKVTADFMLNLEAYDDDPEGSINAVYMMTYEEATARDLYGSKINATITTIDPNDPTKVLSVIQPKQEYHYYNGKERLNFILTVEEMTLIASGINKIECVLPAFVGVRDAVGYIQPCAIDTSNIYNVTEENISFTGVVNRSRGNKSLHNSKYDKYVTNISSFFGEHEKALLIAHLNHVINQEKR